MSRKELFRRYLLFFIGILINSFGIAFITKAALGTSPISSVPYVLSLEFAPTLGTFTFIMNMLFIVFQILLMKKDFEKIQLLQIVVNIIFSGFIDISMSFLSFFAPASLAVRLISLLLGCAILAFGITLEVFANVILVPGEGIVRAIALRLHKEFGSIKVCFDLTLMSTSLILSLLFFHSLNGIGAGTIIAAVIVGFIVKFFTHRLSFIKNILTV